ncbi:complement C1q and tumor necrosis factor-related protein 9A-like [Mytilus trossulus]|uniref:complement C1q and tumor necrosis factor-related protein 9A-like n=1 Tax=Mytilus trossulus TaxID=6551 RepID=UPI003006215F
MIITYILLFIFLQEISSNEHQDDLLKRISNIEINIMNEQSDRHNELSFLKTELENTKISLTDKVNLQASRISALEFMLQQKKPECKGKRTKDLTPVGFYAYMSTDKYNPGKSSKLNFDHVVFNGNGSYDSAEGTFKAKTRGVYIFSYSIVASANSDIPTEIVKDGIVIGSTFSNSYFGYAATSSTTVVVYMEENESCFIRTSSTADVTGSIYSTTLGRTSFAGWLLQVAK